MDKTNVSDDRSFKKFYYSKQFATRFVVKAGEQVLDWQGMIAVAIESKDTESGSSCNAKLYLGNDISFDYPQPDNFINITGERHDEMFSFAHDVSDGDARMHAQIIFSAANKIMVRGYKGEEVSASTGFNIDYVMKDAANGITYIKTDDTLCDVLFNEEYKYYLLLKPKGVDKSADFLKFSL
ncbi:MAG: hypothetical protein OEM38_12165, partial [Gammaproteobacteria bacterium]|nr:hypothetical protein [Gammaproteobacteria bacterium]